MKNSIALFIANRLTNRMLWFAVAVACLRVVGASPKEAPSVAGIFKGLNIDPFKEVRRCELLWCNTSNQETIFKFGIGEKQELLEGVAKLINADQYNTYAWVEPVPTLYEIMFRHSLRAKTNG